MIPTITLQSIVEKWRDAIKYSSAISSFCQTKYGKPLTLYVGFNGKNPPKAENCPFAVIFSGTKTEGLGEPEYQYMVSIGWAILQDDVTITNGVHEVIGAKESDQLGQLLYEAIAEASTNYPVTHVEYDVETQTFFPQFPGRIDAVISVPVTMGANLVY